MTSKVSSEMFPLSELRKMYVQRIRSTAFMDSDSNIIISFKLFSNIVPSFPAASELYGDIIEKALESLSFQTVDGMHQLHEVDYVFLDEKEHCVAVLKNGQDMFMLSPKSSDKPIILTVKSPEDLTVTTYFMKRYYQVHQSEFPYLNEFARIIDSKISRRDQLTKGIKDTAEFCISNKWMKDNILNCIYELHKLVENSSFVLV